MSKHYMEERDLQPFGEVAPGARSEVNARIVGDFSRWKLDVCALYPPLYMVNGRGECRNVQCNSC